MSDPKIITLLSDFGWQDSYVGAMKGAIARINPTLPILDLTHDIPPQDLTAARFCLLNAYRYFPDGTIHVAVVDPGVGSQRRAIALRIATGTLVGPDNGIFSGILSETPALAAVELTNPDYWRVPSPSNTFHGRDIFAPVGAHLASGTPLTEVGNAIDPETLVQLPLPALKPTATGLEGCIQYCDRFGNLITNIPAAAVAGKSWFLTAGERRIPGAKTYNDVARGESVALVGSHDWVEIAVNGGSARSQLNLDCGATVCLRVKG